MSNELECVHDTGKTVYFQVRNSVGQIWNTAGSAFEAYLTANVTDYDIAAAEQGTASGYYVGNMPAAAAGVYNVTAKERAGGSPAESDRAVGVGDLEWDGSAVVPLSSRLAGASYTAPPSEAVVADKLIGRNIAGGSDGGRTVGQAFAAQRNKVAFDVPGAGQFTVFATDDSTPLWTGTYSSSVGAAPVTAVDPA